MMSLIVRDDTSLAGGVVSPVHWTLPFAGRGLHCRRRVCGVSSQRWGGSSTLDYGLVCLGVLNVNSVQSGQCSNV